MTNKEFIQQIEGLDDFEFIELQARKPQML